MLLHQGDSGEEKAWEQHEKGAEDQGVGHAWRIVRDPSGRAGGAGMG